MLEYVNLGDKIELVTELDAKGNQKKYFSSIQGVEGNTLIISAPMTKGRIEPLEIKRVYGMCVYTEKGLYRAEVEVVSREIRDALFLLYIQLRGDLEKFQRRQYYRMDCVLQFNFKLNGDTDAWKKALILDISGGGIRFLTTEEIKEDEELVNHIILELKGVKKELYLTGNVIGVKIDRDSGDTKYEVRESFEDIDEDDRDLIVKYVFDEERRRRRKRKR